MPYEGGTKHDQAKTPEFDEQLVQKLMSDVRVFRKQYSWRLSMHKALDQYSDLRTGSKRSALLKELGKRFGELNAPAQKPEKKAPKEEPSTQSDQQWKQPSLPW